MRVIFHSYYLQMLCLLYSLLAQFHEEKNLIMNGKNNWKYRCHSHLKAQGEPRVT